MHENTVAQGDSLEIPLRNPPTFRIFWRHFKSVEKGKHTQRVRALGTHEENVNLNSYLLHFTVIFLFFPCPFLIQSF